MCPEVYIIVILFVTWTSNAQSLSVPSKPQKGYHCQPDGNPLEDNATYRCALCFFPQNCAANNTCVTGTAGQTCERCIQDEKDTTQYNSSKFQRVANGCVPCESVPLATIALGVFVIIVLVETCIRGFSVSFCTKFKQLINFIQFSLFCGHIKITWPDLTMSMLSVMRFANFNPDMIHLGCWLSWSSVWLFYLQWWSAVLLPTLICLVVWIRDHRLGKEIIRSTHDPNGEVKIRKKWWARVHCRRIAFASVVVFYLPVTISCIQTFACSADLLPGVFSVDQAVGRFLYDQDISCDHHIFSAVNSALLIYLLVYVVFVPLLVTFFSLRQMKWDVLRSQFALYGPIYESYTDNLCFWEAVIMLRKLASVILTDTFLIAPRLQVIAQLSMTGLYTLLILITRPYRSVSWKHRRLRIIPIHDVFELLCCSCILLQQSIALLLTLNINLPYLVYVHIGMVILVLVIWLVCVTAGVAENADPSMTEEDFELPSRKSMIPLKAIFTWKHNKVGEAFTEDEVRTREANVSF